MFAIAKNRNSGEIDQSGASPTLVLLKMTQVTRYMGAAFPRVCHRVLGIEFPFDSFDTGIRARRYICLTSICDMNHNNSRTDNYRQSLLEILSLSKQTPLCIILVPLPRLRQIP